MAKWIAAIVAVLVIAGGVLALTQGSKKSTSTGNTTQNQAASSTDSTSNAETIIYDGQGFSPSKLTVKAGTTVTIKNISAGDDLQFDSDPHPAHTDNEDLNVGTVSPGESMSFKTAKTGTFGYHNHLSPDQRGELVVN